MNKPPDQSGPRRPPTIPYAGGIPAVAAARVNAPAEPPPVPRAITSSVKWRSWIEPSVRFWWLASLVLLTIGVWFVTQQIIAAKSEADLISHGVVVPAIISSVDNDSRVGKQSPPGSTVSLKFDWKDQTEFVSGTLTSKSDKDFIVTGKVVQLRVDPNDPAHWTDRTDPEPIGRRLIAGAVIFPVVFAAGLTALLLRLRIIRIWRDGEAEPFSVVDTRYTALAPLSHSVRAVAVSGNDRRLINVHLPGKLPRPQNGDVVWLVHPRGKPAASIAAAAYWQE